MSTVLYAAPIEVHHRNMFMDNRVLLHLNDEVWMDNHVIFSSIEWIGIEHEYDKTELLHSSAIVANDIIRGLVNNGQ